MRLKPHSVLLAVSLFAISAAPAPAQVGLLLGPQTANVAYAGSTTALAASATFTGLSRDTGAAPGTAGPYAYFNGFFAADQAGTAYIDGSNDGAAWTAEASSALTAGAPLILTVPVLFRYHRIRYGNGATAQGSFVATSSYSAG